MRPVLHAKWGEVIPAGLQAGVYPPEVIALYNTARAQTSAKLAEKDKTHSRPVFQKGDQVLYYKENSFGKVGTWLGPVTIRGFTKNSKTVEVKHNINGKRHR
eukprot:11198402-Lingulodinium_polyedra.AAC.1